MSPKNLLRHPQAKSGLWEFDDIPDDKVRVGIKVQRAVLVHALTGVPVDVAIHHYEACHAVSLQRPMDPPIMFLPGTLSVLAALDSTAGGAVTSTQRTFAPDLQGMQGVRFKRVIMDESATDRSPHPPEEPGFKRLVFCSGKVCAA